MPGVVVSIMRYQYLQGDRRLVPAGNAQTDDRGAYRVWGLNPGDYYVSAVARGEGLGGRGGPGRAIAAAWSRIALRSVEPRGCRGTRSGAAPATTRVN